MRNVLLCFVCFIMAFSVFTSEITAAEKSLTLKEAIEIAFENNHEIRAMKNSLLAEKENIGIARSYLLPKITFEERFMRTDNPTYGFMAKLNQERFAMEDFAIPSLNNPKAINDFQSTLSFEQPLFVRKANLGLDMSKREFMAKDGEFQRKKDEIALKVAKAYLMILTAKEYVKVSEQAVEDAAEHVRIAEAREKAGLGLYSDVLRANTALTEAEQRLVSARKNLAIAERSLGLLLGRSEAVTVSDDVLLIPLRDLDYYINPSLSRKDLEAMKLRYENAKMNVKMAESDYLPMIGIGGSYQFNDHRRPFGSEGGSYQIMAFLRWEIFDGTKREHEIAKAKAKVSEAGEYLEGLKKAITFKIHEAFLEAGEAMKNKELATSALKSAEEGRRLVRIRYENGLSPVVDLLDAQMNVDHARANLVAMENNFKISAINLSYEAGILLSDLNIEK
ncbi:MAG: TolC family protein [Thermodesulfovibrionales bacterium]